MNIEQRRKIERAIAERFIRDALAAGYRVAVDNGEEEFRPYAQADPVLKEMFTVDEEHLRLYKPITNGIGEAFAGSVYFVYGNDGWDVICDYSPNLTEVLAGASALADRYADTPELVEHDVPSPLPPFIDVRRLERAAEDARTTLHANCHVSTLYPSMAVVDRLPFTLGLPYHDWVGQDGHRRDMLSPVPRGDTGDPVTMQAMTCTPTERTTFAITELRKALEAEFGVDFAYSIMGRGHLLAAHNTVQGEVKPSTTRR